MITLIIGKPASGKSLLLENMASHVKNATSIDDISYKFFRILFSGLNQADHHYFCALDASGLNHFLSSYPQSLVRKQYFLIFIDGPFSLIDNRMSVNYLGEHHD